MNSTLKGKQGGNMETRFRFEFTTGKGKPFTYGGEFKSYSDACDARLYQQEQDAKTGVYVGRFYRVFEISEDGLERNPSDL